MNIDISYYMSIFWRRFPHFTLIVVLFTGLGIGTAMVLPSQFKATATLIVESPQIPDNLASSTVRTVAAEQLQIIEQRLLTRANLIDTSARLGVFEDQAKMSSNSIVNEMRERTTFKATSGGRNRNNATFLRVSFDSENPVIAARVANEFVTLILDENVRMRTALAGGTLEFFEEEVERLTSEIDQKSAEILKFKSENANALPENRDFLLDRQASLTNVSRNAAREIEAIELQKLNAIELFEATGAISGRDAGSPEEQAYRQAQRELDDALLIYSASNPRVALLQTRVERLEERYLESLNNGNNNQPDVNRPQAVLDAQMADLDARILALRERTADAEAELAVVEELLGQVPANGVVIENLELALSQTQIQYRQSVANLSAAATGERIELLSKGQRISVLENATVPERASSPNRYMIAATGLGAGVSLGLGLIVLLELLNKTVRRPVEISDKLGITPFAILPYVRTEQETLKRRWSFVLMILAFVLGVPIAILAVHSFVYPLDGLFESLFNRFGLTLTL